MQYLDINILIICTTIIISISIISSVVYQIMTKMFRAKMDLIAVTDKDVIMSNPVDTDFTIMEALSGFIDLCYSEYMSMHIEYVEMDYIKPDAELEILNDMSIMVKDRISVHMIKRLALIYDSNYIDEVITAQVLLFVTNQIVEKNKVKE